MNMELKDFKNTAEVILNLTKEMKKLDVSAFRANLRDGSIEINFSPSFASPLPTSRQISGIEGEAIVDIEDEMDMKYFSGADLQGLGETSKVLLEEEYEDDE